jgi:hypothetical protein
LGVVGPITSVEDGLLWKALFAAVLWVMLTIVIVRYGGDLTKSYVKNDQVVERDNEMALTANPGKVI